MAKNSRAIPTWAVYPGIALIAFVVWRKFSAGEWLKLPGRKKFHPIGKQNKIRIDGYGDGRFGARRSDHSHNGIDLVVTPGESILSPITGKVVRYSYPYADDSRFSGVHIQNDEYLVKMWYLSPVLVKPGQQVTQGQAIGTAQKISTKYGSGMIDHVHVEVWPNGLGRAIDPAPLFGLG